MRNKLKSQYDHYERNLETMMQLMPSSVISSLLIQQMKAEGSGSGRSSSTRPGRLFKKSNDKAALIKCKTPTSINFVGNLAELANEEMRGDLDGNKVVEYHREDEEKSEESKS